MKQIDFEPNLSSYIDFNNLAESRIKLRGMVQNSRPLAWGGFIILRTPNYLIQCVVNTADSGISLNNIPIESTVDIEGKVVSAKIKDESILPRDFEIQIDKITLISSPAVESLPIDTSKKELSVHLDTKLDLRPLSLRHVRERAIFRIAAAINNGFSECLTDLGFTRINSPKIVYSGAEGGANIFKLDYFGRDAYLAQSPQFYKQMMVGVFGRVFETAPVFRAEKHNTSRHVNEYTSLDLEMQLNESFHEIIQVEAKVLNHIFKKIESECAYEVSVLGLKIPHIDRILILEFEEAHELVYKNFNIDHRSENDLAPEEEELICQYAEKEYGSEFVFVIHYPTSKRPFYAMSDPADPSKTLSFDLLFRGVEITTGGQRLHAYDDYLKKMKEWGMNPELFSSYLQAFKFGMPPHGGLGLGLERLTAKLCNLKNIKEATLFPRDIDRLEP